MTTFVRLRVPIFFDQLLDQRSVRRPARSFGSLLSVAKNSRMISCGCGRGTCEWACLKADKPSSATVACLPAAEILLKSCRARDDAPATKSRRAQNEAWSRTGFHSPAAGVGRGSRVGISNGTLGRECRLEGGPRNLLAQPCQPAAVIVEAARQWTAMAEVCTSFLSEAPRGLVAAGVAPPLLTAGQERPRVFSYCVGHVQTSNRKA